MKMNWKAACKVGVMLLLTVCMTVGMAAPAFAANGLNMDEMYDKLWEMMECDKEDYDRYDELYAASLPLVYAKNKSSYYVALGGGTVEGHKGVSYAELLADNLKLQYEALGDDTLTAHNWKAYINKHKAAIRKADLITYQLDASPFLENLLETQVNWEAYIEDPEMLVTMNNLHGDLAAELTPDYGASNADLMADLLEVLLYECVVYNMETIEAVKEIRKLNPDAVILVPGLYDPLQRLVVKYAKPDGSVSEFVVGEWIADMVKFSNVYLLMHTKDMENVAFVDVSGTVSNGFDPIELSSGNMVGPLGKILYKTQDQRANAEGHQYLYEQLKNALADPCKHPNTKLENVKEATCTEYGYSGDTHCADCGEKLKSGSKTAKASHQYGSWIQIQAPTCSVKGSQYRVCKVCEHRDEAEIATLSHTWNAGEVVKEPDCTNPGSKRLTCTVCNKTSVVGINANGHTWDLGTVTKQPACEVGGEKTFKCTVTGCTGSKTEAVPAVGHIYGDYVSDNNATCQKDGTKTATCTGCSKTDTVTDEGSVTPHDFKDGVCADCGEEDPDAKGKGPGIYLWIFLILLVGGIAGGVVFFLQKKKLWIFNK